MRWFCQSEDNFAEEAATFYTFRFDLMSETNDSLARTLALIADELRSLANNNLIFTDDPYQVQRNRRVLELAAELQSLVDARPSEDIRRIFTHSLGYLTPMVATNTATIDPEGRVLLIRRADNGKWALPGGACDVGETPAQAAARETWEESGYVVEITRLLGVFDERLNGRESGRHLYVILFAAAPVRGEARLSNETLDVRWFGWDELPWSELTPGHDLQLQLVMQWWLNPNTPAYFDWGEWQPPA